MPPALVLQTKHGILSPISPPTSAFIFSSPDGALGSEERSAKTQSFEPPKEFENIFASRLTPKPDASADDWDRRTRARRDGLLKVVAALEQQDDVVMKEFCRAPDEDEPKYLNSFTLDGEISQESPHIPFQKFHTSPWAIPSALADVSCEKLCPRDLLSQLNQIFGTSLTLQDDSDLEECLLEFIVDSCDVGQAYGYLRPYWFLGLSFGKIQESIAARKQHDLVLRRDAINGDQIVNPRVPPRRVWDLYSNRVLPFYALPSADIPRNLWAVSHSWVDEPKRTKVMTPINGFAWPVPIPSAASLDQIRIELLNLGAEYVFLDVLCLMQEGEKKDEGRRKKEWRLDVPTIGYIYQHDIYQTTITYFNGLGLPFDVTAADFSDDRHWFRRVWTLQEASDSWMPGGLTTQLAKEGWGRPEFVGRLDWIIQVTRRDPPKLFKMIDIVRRRAFAGGVDRISSLAYILKCPTLPIHDVNSDQETAWGLLVENLTDNQRADILFLFPGPGQFSSMSWVPNWSTLIEFGDPPALPTIVYKPTEKVQHLDGSSPQLGYRHGHDAYYNSAYVLEGCYVDGSSIRIPLPRIGQHASEVTESYETFDISAWGRRDLLQPDTPYVLVGVADLRLWVVGKDRGVRSVLKQAAIQVEKVSTAQMGSTEERTRLLYSKLGEDRLVVYC